MQHIVPIKSNISYRTKLALPVVPVPIQGLHEDGGVLKTRGNRGVGAAACKTRAQTLCDGEVDVYWVGTKSGMHVRVGLDLHAHTQAHALHRSSESTDRHHPYSARGQKASRHVAPERGEWSDEI